MAKLIQQYHGRVVDSPGDNLLAEFASVVDAVQCAVEIQKVLKSKNNELSEDRKMEFRIGINLGDVIEEGGRIYGDGVNIAARIESLAEPGGICLSGSAYEQIENKLALGYEYLGKQSVKNITKPVRVYKVPLERDAGKEKMPWSKRWRLAAIVGVAVVVLGGAAFALRTFYLHSEGPRTEMASEERMAFPLPEMPSIAVLPFVNMSGDPEQEYLADGITENMITALSKTPKIFIIASNSTFTYKNKSVNIPQVAEELGVQYVLEGSVQISGNRLRITTQLVDALSGHQLWAERYDRTMNDIFAVQDEITKKIITALRVKLTEGEQARVYDKTTDNLDSFLKFLQGTSFFFRFNKESNIQARRMFEEAIAWDSKNASAYTMLAWTHVMEVRYGSSRSPGKSLERAVELAQQALAINDGQDPTHSLLGHIYLLKGQFDKAIAEAELAVVLNPNSADAHAHLGMTLNYMGNGIQAVPLLQKAIRLNPIPPNWYLHTLGDAYRLTEKYDEAITVYKRVLHLNPEDIFAHTGLTFTYSLLGLEEEAHTAAEKALKIDPKLSFESYVKTLPFKSQDDREHLIDALHKAGLM
jgi:adenylate cyclase